MPSLKIPFFVFFDPSGVKNHQNLGFGGEAFPGKRVQKHQKMIKNWSFLTFFSIFRYFGQFGAKSGGGVKRLNGMLVVSCATLELCQAWPARKREGPVFSAELCQKNM